MQIFTLKNGHQVVCDSKSTRTGFRHGATLLNAKGYEIGRAKCCYQNRTWESFQYQTVVNKVIEKFLPDQKELKI